MMLAHAKRSADRSYYDGGCLFQHVFGFAANMSPQRLHAVNTCVAVGIRRWVSTRALQAVASLQKRLSAWRILSRHTLR